VTDTRDAQRARLAAAQAELVDVEVDSRRLLAFSEAVLAAIAKAGTEDNAPLAGELAGQIRALLDRYELAKAEAFELAAELREQGVDLPDP
jgi:hypothetical protein